MDYNEEIRAWASLLRSPKTSTLKFAVARAIIDEVRDAQALHTITITRERLAYRIVSYYWFQVRLFRLKQAASDIQEPNVVRRLRQLELTSDNKWRPARPDVKAVVEFVATDGFREVIPRFNNGISGSIFDIRVGGELSITKGNCAFIKTFEPLLMRSILSGWAEQVERYNLTPRAFAKVSFDGHRRKSVAKWARPLRKIDNACFYCRVLTPKSVQVDHVVPWSFLLDDPAWNLVLACDRCNRLKRDRLPAKRYLTLLCERNSRLATEDSGAFGNSVRLSLTQLPHGDANGLEKSLSMLCEQASLHGFSGGWLPP